MVRHWFLILLFAPVCFASGPAPVPLKSQPANILSRDAHREDAPAAKTEAAAGIAGGAAAFTGVIVNLPERGLYAAAAVGIPAALTLAKFYLPSESEFEQLARTDPIAFLDACRRRAAELRGYRATLIKRERIHGKLYEAESIRTQVRAEPLSILMLWEKGAREVLGTATEGVLYVAGENGGKLKVWRPSARLLPKWMDISPTDTQARSSARYAIVDGGMLLATERTYRAWIDARDAGRLEWKFEGTRVVEEAGGRRCYVVTRTCNPPSIDPFLITDKPTFPKQHSLDASQTVTVMIDVETWLQIGSRITGVEGQLVGEYFFRDVELNPLFGPGTFQQSALKK